MSIHKLKYSILNDSLRTQTYFRLSLDSAESEIGLRSQAN